MLIMTMITAIDIGNMLAWYHYIIYTETNDKYMGAAHFTCHSKDFIECNSLNPYHTSWSKVES